MVYIIKMFKNRRLKQTAVCESKEEAASRASAWQLAEAGRQGDFEAFDGNISEAEFRAWLMCNAKDFRIHHAARGQ